MIATALSVAFGALAGPVGERHLQASDATAALRDAEHRTTVRVTVWYPAAEGAKEERIDLGPPGKPLFVVGAVAPDAPFADAKVRPVILFSHGFGGTARMMGWFGVPLARAGYVVVAVDHPGNNGLDKMTTPGAILSWTRADDLAAALGAAKADPEIGPRIDGAKVGVSGFSAGGFTTLVSAGARPEMFRFVAFCRRHPEDGVCRPQKEYALSMDDAEKALKSPELAGAVAHAGDDHRIPGVKAAFAIAPAIVQGLTPESLASIKVPTAILLGDADPVAPPDTNGRVAARMIPGAEVRELPGVKHYDFLSTCTDAGRAVTELCRDEPPQDPTHQAAIDMALDFFGRTLGAP
ncbi:prolyl oligopeptidase family serine peptidase [Phenylobacterium sp.]|uniref:alpha/beta hydrolase family protein n=1 Tax=Phenylobacterium sp. TaxID=1871053 RepID=UPI0025FEB75E|nr:prolyl oligopeptidase family serine peptidase [Phenylobacterium sp.]